MKKLTLFTCISLNLLFLSEAMAVKATFEVVVDTPKMMRAVILSTYSGGERESVKFGESFHPFNKPISLEMPSAPDDFINDILISAQSFARGGITLDSQQIIHRIKENVHYKIIFTYDENARPKSRDRKEAWHVRIEAIEDNV